ncbi:hypothetical protein [Pararhizobium sp. PWRC1-1]|uniref:hypothetical protein n=1 Tax=Pararhizobium sp. PWRC1-1 TaxID=2804566 RepID=UPI003CF250B5
MFAQSFFVIQAVIEKVETERCTAGFLEPQCTTEIKNVPVLDERGSVVTTTRFVGLDN